MVSQLEAMQTFVRHMRGFGRDESYDTLTREETMEIVAVSWYAWGVLEQAATTANTRNFETTRCARVTTSIPKVRLQHVLVKRIRFPSDVIFMAH